MTVEPNPANSLPEPELPPAQPELLLADHAVSAEDHPSSALAADELSPTEDAPPAPPASSPRRLLPIVICLLIALPFGYLLLRRPHPAPPPSAAVAPNPASTIPVLEQIVRARPTADNRLSLSLAYIRANQPSSAIPVLQALLTQDPGNANGWNNLCVAHTMQMEYNNAISDCRRAISLSPGSQLAQNNLRWAESENQKALDAIDTAARLAPTARDTNSYLAEGLNYLHIGGYDKAIQLWQQVLTRDPHNALAANDIGVAYMMKRQPDRAVPWFSKAMQLDPTLQIAKNNLAWATSERSSAAQTPAAAKSN